LEILLPAAALAFVLSLLTTPLLRRISIATGLLDRPNFEHKTHAGPAPTLGGAALALSVTLALLWSGETPDWTPAVFGACGALLFVGALDDVRQLSPWFKLGAELLSGVAVCAAGLTLPLGPVWIAAPATVFWLAVCTNGFNLTDGADGLAATAGVAGALGMCGAALLHGQQPLAILLAIFAAALAGFLLFNFPPASIFLGDSGALPVGFLLGICGVAWARSAPDWVAASAPVFALALPLGEALLSAVRRALRGDPIFRADRRHIHHRLADRGLGPRAVTLWCGAYSAFGAAVGLVVAWSGASGLSAAAVAVFAVVSVAGLRRLRYSELECAARTLWRRRAS
jgi:UDP-GlcNAc:undecaprenyl-phosphate GlcNAc-1-phosphate transferase